MNSVRAGARLVWKGPMSTVSTLIENPILRGFHPDPSWVWHHGRAWLATSSFGLVPGLPVYTSTDLAHWDYAGPAIDEAMGGKLFLKYIHDDTRGVFAPSIRVIGDALVIVSTVVSIEVDRAIADGCDPDELRAMSAANGNFALVSHDDGRTWEGPHWVTGAIGNDPDLFVDDDGTAWWLAAHQSYNPKWPYQSDIYLRRLDLDTWTLSGPELVPWHGALEGAVWAESPHLFRHDGRYYLIAAEAGTSRLHAESVARSTSLTEYFEGNPANPILTHRNLGSHYPVQNIGHCDMLRDDDGRWWGVCLGSRIVKGYSFMGREPFVFPIEWEDGWPVFAPGTGLVPRFVDARHTGADAEASAERTDANGTDQAISRVPADRLLRSPRQPGWLWTKVDHTDFTIFADVIAGADSDAAIAPTREVRIQQTESDYAALTIDPATREVRAIASAHGVAETLWTGPYDETAAYSIRLNGTITEFRVEPASAMDDAGATATGTDCEPTLLVRAGEVPEASIAAGGYPVPDTSSPVTPTESTLLASRSAGFLSTEEAGGYLGCLAGVLR